MPHYISLINYTDQGIKNVKGIPDRVTAARQAMEKAKGKLVSYHLTLGQYDAVVISEFPDDASYTSVVLSTASQGNLRTTTLKAFTQEEAVRLIRSLP